MSRDADASRSGIGFGLELGRVRPHETGQDPEKMESVAAVSNVGIRAVEPAKSLSSESRKSSPFRAGRGRPEA
jgi:hypothetical protein